MKVHSIMTRPPQTCRTDSTLAVASRRMKTTGCGMLVVLDSHGALAGVITDRDVALAVGDSDRAPAAAASAVMARPVHTCRPDDDLHAALARMAAARVRRLPVVDAEGNVKGVISIDDIILWGVRRRGIGLHELTGALRAIHAPRSPQPEIEMPAF